MASGAKNPKPLGAGRLIRRIIIADIFAIILLLILFVGRRDNSLGEKKLAVGSTTFRFYYERDSTQADWISQHRWDPSSGEMSRGRGVSLRLPGGLLSFGYVYDPTAAIRERLPEDVPALTRLLDSNNPFQVFCVAEKLSATPFSAVPALPSLILAAERGFHVADSIDLISLAATREAVPALVAGLSTTNLTLRAYCAQLLGTIGTNAATAAGPILNDLQASSNPWVGKVSLIQAHFRISGDLAPSLPIIQHDLTNSTDHHEKWRLLYLLREAGPQAAPTIPQLLSIANDTNSTRLRFTALRALAKITGDESLVLPALLPVLTNTEPGSTSSRSSAIAVLGDLGAAGIPHLFPIYRGTNLEDKVQAARALAQIGPPAINALNEIQAELFSGKAERIQFACTLITNLGQHIPLALPALTNALHSPSPRGRQQVAFTLHSLGYYNDTLVRVLVDSMADPRTDQQQAFKTLRVILQTNLPARLVFQDRLAIHTRALARNNPHFRDLSQRYAVQKEFAQVDAHETSVR